VIMLRSGTASTSGLSPRSSTLTRVDLQSTGFVLDPAGRVVVSVYSSRATGRLVPEDVISLARYLREHPPA
jgi:hypothetical protein